MVDRESSGIFNMKYIYEFKLEKDEYEGFIIVEYINDMKVNKWTLDFIINYFNDEPIFLDVPFTRAKYWLKQNHPELLI